MELNNKAILGYGLLILFAVVLSGALGYIGPIPQPQEYHRFVDDRLLLGIPNFHNVLSNLPFLLVGWMGLVWLSKSNQGYLITLKAGYWLLFFGVALVCFGSGYYHIWPDNGTLVWDRLPMTIGFMGLFSVVIAEYVSVRAGRIFLWPLVILGALSVAYWHWTELQGAGDLRPYILVQFYPILAMPVLLLCFKGKFDRQSGYWWLFLWYLLAKLFEHFDQEIYALFAGQMSGHSLKHVAAAIGVYMLIRAYQSRRMVEA